MQQDNTTWTQDRIDLIKRTICPKGIGTDEFLLFIEQCKRSGLDPLLKEAFCVPRNANIGSKQSPKWVTKHEFQPSEAGMLTRAEKMADYRGVQCSAVYAEDEIQVDQGEGVVVHRFNPAKRKGMLVGAWARVVRDGKVPVVVWLDFWAYVQQTPLWSKMPATMIEKCARAAALRKAYPSQFGGLYIAGERPDDVEQPEEEQAAPELRKPALPEPSPVETLERTPVREPVPVRREEPEDATFQQSAREPGSDDGEPDEMEREVLAIRKDAAAAQSLDDLMPLKPRTEALGKGSESYKSAAKALRDAHTRIAAKVLS